MFIATACEESSGAPANQAYFDGVETVFQTYDSQIEDVKNEFELQLPRATTPADVEHISREQFRAALVAYAAFEDGLVALVPPTSITNEHGELLKRVSSLATIYEGKMRRLDEGTETTDPLEREEQRNQLTQAVNALNVQCRTLQEIANIQGAGVDLVCN